MAALEFCVKLGYTRDTVFDEELHQDVDGSLSIFFVGAVKMLNGSEKGGFL